uniref:heparan-alpha-glucosaminide N-acetyltransferase domain-containing protein n=1 Tax=Klebsiella aerogenes TaxID=548 RepID=UPI0013D4E63E
ALPHLVASPILDARWLAWLGLGRLPLNTADYVPVLPWFGCVLAGMVAARLSLASPFADMLSAWRPRFGAARLIAWGGRHSLPIYLLH